MVAMALLLSSSRADTVWPAAADPKFDSTDVELVVVPLNRLGAALGQSGAEVFVVYLRSARQGKGSPKPSNALVMKLDKREHKLAEEKKGAEQWPDVAADRFAKPLELFSVRGYGVLVAPFRAEVRPPDPDEHRLKFRTLRDLYRKIHDEGVEDDEDGRNGGGIGEGVGDALALVSLAHAHGTPSGRPRRLAMQYSQKYDWYLRDTRKPASAAARKIEQLFGNAEHVQAFGERWANPIRQVGRILSDEDEFEGAFGPVHGDLHPKNIIFDADGKVQVIDFGWARNDMHVVVDYVLLDINLRAVALPSLVPEGELLAAARHLLPGDPAPAAGSLAADRLEIVRREIWGRAVDQGAVSGGDGRAWLREYLIPYFLVAYGLLVYLDQAQNQRALLASVLAAAERIDRERGSPR